MHAKMYCMGLLVLCCGVAMLSASEETTTTTTASTKASATTAASKASPTTRPKISDEALETALGDKRYLTRQIKCALGEGACDPVGRRLRTLAPLVLRGACPQCSPQETRQIKRTLSHIQRNYPKEWAKIVKQYAGLQ